MRTPEMPGPEQKPVQATLRSSLRSAGVCPDRRHGFILMAERGRRRWQGRRE
jgi:hypothetical protein